MKVKVLMGAGSNLPIDLSHVNPFSITESLCFNFQQKSLKVVISARKLGHLARPA
jgi:hypothetical protein